MNVFNMTALELVEELLDNTDVAEAAQESDPEWYRDVDWRAKELRLEQTLAFPVVDEFE